MRNWIITIKVDDDVTDTVGPFTGPSAESDADGYCRRVLEPSLKGSTFHLSELTSPVEMETCILKVLHAPKVAPPPSQAYPKLDPKATH